MGNPTATHRQANIARLEADGLDPRSKDDSVLNVTYVFCHAHCRPHSTGWCTVGLADKTPLLATESEAAYDEARSRGFWVYGDPWDCANCGVTIEANSPDTSCPEGRGYGHQRAGA